MPNATVGIGLGAILSIESATPGIYTALGDLREVELGGLKVGTDDATDHSHTDGTKRKVGTLIELGDVKGTFHFDGKSTAYTTLVTQAKTRAAKNFRIQLPSGYTLTGPFIVTSIDPASPKDKVMTCGITLTPAAPYTEA